MIDVSAFLVMISLDCVLLSSKSYFIRGRLGIEHCFPKHGVGADVDAKVGNIESDGAWVIDGNCVGSPLIDGNGDEMGTMDMEGFCDGSLDTKG